MALALTTITAVERYWADFFGCPESHFASAATLALPHAGLGDYHGVWLFRRDDSGVISAPPAELKRIIGALHTRMVSEIWAQGLLARALEGSVERVVGPACIGYADTGSLAPPTGGARLLSAAAGPALEELRGACPPIDWEHGGSETAGQPLTGAFVGDKLVALAGYKLRGEQIAHIAVVTHPGHRGQGHGAAVVALLARHALSQGLIPQYRTLLANVPSLRIAARLGFQPYAEILALRLR